ncbi:acetate non-utilizing protein 9 [Lunasporangiospora selenospora]|uniref:Succinate dehydrogenase assembly factor 3 n=1 Tax=Lunasporangiospora selenospora TaxID=979761 RepID=A0A9P6FTH4_9FUNG|nr:acetate non-utilizing protein 9 [Lunasporangiospora selenospora]
MASQKALTPPLTLYRQILRAHRKHLPSQFRILGDGYVKSEFHLHKNVDNPLHIIGFLEQWQGYLDHVLASSAATPSSSTDSTSRTGATTEAMRSDQEGSRQETLDQIIAQGKPFGKKLDQGLLDKMSDQQLGQLFELRKEARGLQNEEELKELEQQETRLFKKVETAFPGLIRSSEPSSSKK